MKKVMELWKKWFGKRDVSVVENVAKEISIKTEKNVRKSSLLEDLEIKKSLKQLLQGRTYFTPWYHLGSPNPRGCGLIECKHTPAL